LLEEKPEEAVKRMNWYFDVFGQERFFVELQQHNIKEITDLNKSCLRWRTLRGEVRRHERCALHQSDRFALAGYSARHSDQLIAQRPGPYAHDG